MACSEHLVALTCLGSLLHPAHSRQPFRQTDTAARPRMKTKHITVHTALADVRRHGAKGWSALRRDMGLFLDAGSKAPLVDNKRTVAPSSNCDCAGRPSNDHHTYHTSTFTNMRCNSRCTRQWWHVPYRNLPQKSPRLKSSAVGIGKRYPHHFILRINGSLIV